MIKPIDTKLNAAAQNNFSLTEPDRTRSSASIEVRNLSYCYGKKRVLDCVNLTLPRGINILLGPNGAGKSTLFSLLTGLKSASLAKTGAGKDLAVDTANNEIKVCGLSLQNARRNIMRSMGVVFQQSTLDLDLTVKQNLLYHASLQGISSANALSNISDILSVLALKDKLDVKVRALNGGHRRRVEIARALLHLPSVLLLDEPTVGLDIESRALIIKYVRALTQREGLCVLWATHLMDEVTLEDRLIVLSGGDVKAHGITQDLCSQYQVDDVPQLYRKLTASMEVI
ncbi:ABC transporter ATP-binding protein [Paraglaciecola mesophila]|uniref:ABC transporter ATP-binding protein n=1 Tax=Paraglaciecola mesophila TaxID=197222 RepID=A0ABU9SPJ6_9ALTE